MRPSVAIDLGTVNTLVYTAKRGLLIDEPSVVAVQEDPWKVLAVGSDADRLYGCLPAGVEVVKPLRDGVVSDLGACALMLKEFVRRAFPHRRLRGLWTLVCVPGGATDIERRALVEAAEFGYPHLRVTMIDEAVAAALGSEASAYTNRPVMIADIGGGTTELAVTVDTGTIRSRSIRVAGNAMDAAIIHAVRAECGLIIGEHTAEHLKIAVGLEETAEPVTVCGIDAGRSGRLRRTEVAPKLVAAALELPVKAIVSALTGLLEETPPDLAEEILDGGIHLGGGGALLPGLSAQIAEGAHCHSEVVPDPLRCTIRGLARLLDPSARPSQTVHLASQLERSPIRILEDVAGPSAPSPQVALCDEPAAGTPTGGLRYIRAHVRSALLVGVAGVIAALVVGLAVRSTHHIAHGARPADSVPALRSSIPAPRSVPTTVAAQPAVVATSTGTYSATYTVRSKTVDVSLAASQRCWIEIRSGSASGPIIYEAILPAGGHTTFNDLPGLWVSLGYPAGITLHVEGVPIALPGGGPFDVTIDSGASTTT